MRPSQLSGAGKTDRSTPTRGPGRTSASRATCAGCGCTGPVHDVAVGAFCVRPLASDQPSGSSRVTRRGRRRSRAPHGRANKRPVARLVFGNDEAAPSEDRQRPSCQAETRRLSWARPIPNQSVRPSSVRGRGDLVAVAAALGDDGIVAVLDAQPGGLEEHHHQRHVAGRAGGGVALEALPGGLLDPVDLGEQAYTGARQVAPAAP
jgi:hypothetical protein